MKNPGGIDESRCRPDTFVEICSRSLKLRLMPPIFLFVSIAYRFYSPRKCPGRASSAWFWRRARTGALLVSATAMLSASASAQSGVVVTGAPTLVVGTAVAGAQPATAVNTTTTYTLTGTSFFQNRKVRARLSADLPTGVTVTAQLAVGFLNSSSGTITLTRDYQDVISANLVLATAYTITYRMTATTAVAPQIGNVTVQYCIDVSGGC